MIQFDLVQSYSVETAIIHTPVLQTYKSAHLWKMGGVSNKGDESVSAQRGGVKCEPREMNIGGRGRESTGKKIVEAFKCWHVEAEPYSVLSKWHNVTLPNNSTH